MQNQKFYPFIREKNSDRKRLMNPKHRKQPLDTVVVLRDQTGREGARVLLSKWGSSLAWSRACGPPRGFQSRFICGEPGELGPERWRPRVQNGSGQP